MDTAATIDIVRRLYSTVWEWNSGAIDRMALQLGLSSYQRTDARATFIFPGGPTCSFYFSEDQILFVESTLEILYNPEELSVAEFQTKEREYLTNYKNLVDLATQEFGRPLFEGAYGSSGFPEGQNAVRLALWKTPSAVFMIEYKHDDRELPMYLCVDVYPQE
ncbi:MAG: hypothetical protein U0744_07860 [Gemmataceae bacterium]